MTGTAERDALLGLAPCPPDRSRRYGPHPSQVVDYFLPRDGSPGRRLTVLHGGYWRQAYDRSHLSPTAAALAGRGFAVALVEYRRLGGDGGWPGTYEDVRQAVEEAWDGDPAVLLGHSAGGQLALWAAHRAPGAVDRVVALAPVADLAHGRRLRLSGGVIDELLGADGDLDALDPVRLLPAVRPVAILHGTADPDVPVELSRRYAAAAGRGGAGARVRLTELPGVGHFAPLTPGSAAFPTLLAALREDGR